MAESKLVSIQEFAVIMKVSRRAVQKAISEGRISASRDGNKWFLNPIEAKKQWLENTSLVAARRSNKNIGQDDSDNDVDKISIGEAERREKVFKSKMAELKFHEAKNLLIPKEKVQKSAFNLARKVRDAMLNIPNRISHEVAAEVDPFKVEQILLKEINQALESLVTKEMHEKKEKQKADMKKPT